MSIAAVFSAMQNSLTEALAAAGERQPSFGLGVPELSRREDLPRIVWVPLGSRVKGPDQRGYGTDNPRQLWTREAEVEAHVWADGVAAVEVLMNHMVAAMTAAVGGAYKPLAERWDPDTDLSKGSLCILHMQLLLPFTDEPFKQAIPTSTSLTGQIVS